MSQQIPAKHILMKDTIISLEHLKGVVQEDRMVDGKIVKVIRFVYHNQGNGDSVIPMDDHDDSVTQFNRVCDALGL